MVIFKCPYCRTEYEMTTARLSFQQRSYVPIFTLMNASKGETSDINRNLGSR